MKEGNPPFKVIKFSYDGFREACELKGLRPSSEPHWSIKPQFAYFAGDPASGIKGYLDEL